METSVKFGHVGTTPLSKKVVIRERHVSWVALLSPGLTVAHQWVLPVTAPIS